MLVRSDWRPRIAVDRLGMSTEGELTAFWLKLAPGMSSPTSETHQGCEACDFVASPPPCAPRECEVASYSRMSSKRAVLM
jgi:hypothetical protein